MTTSHEALVRRPLDEVTHQLGDTDWLLAALPGTTLTRDSDGVSGTLRLKLGSLQITYRVTIRAAGPDEGVHAVTIAVSGKEARGAGTLAATVQIELNDADDAATQVRAILDVTATGRGEAVADEAWGRAAETLLAGVVAALTAAEAAPAATPAAPADAVTPAPPAAPRPAPILDEPARPQSPVQTTTGPSPQRLAAAAAFVLLLLLVVRGARRRRSA
jgi:carbon monoxide dehydrogenase subunit G